MFTILRVQLYTENNLYLYPIITLVLKLISAYCVPKIEIKTGLGTPEMQEKCVKKPHRAIMDPFKLKPKSSQVSKPRLIT